MCGIVGFFGANNKDRYGCFEDMLQLDILRGDDSTGVVAVRKKHIDIVKDIMYPADLIASKEYREKIINPENYLLIGHNRFATRGEVLAKNAHPFRHGHISLVHNGTLSDHNQMIPDAPKFDTDSEAMTYAIAKLGIKEAWKKFNGAATIVFWDNNQKTLNIVSNGKRSINWNMTKDDKGLFFSSEAWMMRAGAGRANRKVDLADQFFFPEDDKLYKFSMDKDGKISYVTEALEKYVYTWSRRSHLADRWPQDWEDDGDYTIPADKKQVTVRVEHAASCYCYRCKEERGDRGEGALPFHGGGTRSSTVPAIEVDDPYTRDDIRAKTINEETFNHRYLRCCHCNVSLHGEYDDAVVIDDKNASCGPCVDEAERLGLSLNVVHNH